MAALAGIGAGHDDLVALTGTDLVIAAGAAVRLHCLIGLHVLDVERVGIVDLVGPVVVVDHRRGDYAKSAHTSSAITTTTAAPTNT